MQKRVTVIGGGIAGMQTAGQLNKLGFKVQLLEKGNRLGGHVADWYHLFPDSRSSEDLINSLKTDIHEKVEVLFGTEVHRVQKRNNSIEINLTDGENITTDAVVVTSGFDLFDARKKEEYGFGIYENVVTSAWVEEKLKEGKSIKTPTGKIPQRIAIIHCVGSRDEKAGNTYCSKVCCVTGVKQAMELKKHFPTAEIFNFYMDLRMFDRYFEDIYFQAQTQGIRFIRGRLSEACENQDKTVLVKAEDTLLGKPIKMNVDLLVLMVGMVASKGTIDTSLKFDLQQDKDLFLKKTNHHEDTNSTSVEGVFMAGTCTGPKTITETLADAKSAALHVASFLQNN